MTFLSPYGALVALSAVAPLGAFALGARRADAVRRALGLAEPTRRGRIVRPALAAAALFLLGLAAAQPALVHRSHRRVRTDVQALFVVDVSRSMAASATPRSPTRLDRALAAAARLRASIPDVASGVATITDRLLPDLLPVPDPAGFDAVLARTVEIESPPPRETSARATSYTPLLQAATGGYFAPSARRRIVVLLGDGESNGVDTASLGRALAPSRGYRFEAVRFWAADESVFDADGRAEPGYRPDASGRALLAGIAAATGGRFFEARDLGGAVSYLRRLAGSGPTATERAELTGRTPLAPYPAALAVVLLVLLAAQLSVRRGGVAWKAR